VSEHEDKEHKDDSPCDERPDDPAGPESLIVVPVGPRGSLRTLLVRNVGHRVSVLGHLERIRR